MVLKTNRRYLRCIYQLLLKKKEVRQIDLALAMGYSRSSVSIAVKQLKDDGLIILQGKNISLTSSGISLAKASLMTYQRVYLWLLDYGIDSYEAMQYADKMESNFDEEFIKLLVSDKRRCFK